MRRPATRPASSSGACRCTSDYDELIKGRYADLANSGRAAQGRRRSRRRVPEAIHRRRAVGAPGHRRHRFGTGGGDVAKGGNGSARLLVMVRTLRRARPSASEGAAAMSALCGRGRHARACPVARPVRRLRGDAGGRREPAAGRYSGPEAHRLLSCESVVPDGDVDLRDEYAQPRVAVLVRRTADARRPEPTERPARRAGRAGLALLGAPAWRSAARRCVRLGSRRSPRWPSAWPRRSAARWCPSRGRRARRSSSGLSPPVLAGATGSRPSWPARPLLAGAALLALRVREQPRTALAFWTAALVAVAPWLAAQAAGSRPRWSPSRPRAGCGGAGAGRPASWRSRSR